MKKDIESTIQTYLDGQASPAQIQALRSWIAAEPRHARLFTRYCLLHSLLHSKFVEQELRVPLGRLVDLSPDAMAAGITEQKTSFGDVTHAADRDSERVRQIEAYAQHKLEKFLAAQAQNAPTAPPKRGLFATIDWQAGLRAAWHRLEMLSSWTVKSVVGLAALAMTAIGVLAVYDYVHRQPPTAPPVIATLGATYQAQWDRVPQGTELYPGPLELKQGFAELVFENDVTVILEGPAEVVLEDLDHMSLPRGRLVATVGPKGHGFTVQTPGASIVDWGTQFGVHVTPEKGTEAAVFNGSVQLRSRRSRGRAAPASHLLQKGYEVSASAEGWIGPPRPVNPEHGFRCSWEDVLYIPATTGALQYLRSMPPSLAFDAFEASGRVHVLLERTGVTLTQDMTVRFVASGYLDTWNEANAPTQIVPAGTQVDSYLLHVDMPSSHSSRPIMLNGSVTFSRPIIGLLLATDELNATDWLLGVPHTQYASSYKNRGTLREGAGSVDEFVIAADGHTLHATFVLTQIDEIRVLVTAANDMNRAALNGKHGHGSTPANVDIMKP